MKLSSSAYAIHQPALGAEDSSVQKTGHCETVTWSDEWVAYEWVAYEWVAYESDTLIIRASGLFTLINPSCTLSSRSRIPRLSVNCITEMHH